MRPGQLIPWVHANEENPEVLDEKVQSRIVAKLVSESDPSAT